MSSQKDLEKFIKFLALKSTQIVVQSRLGEKLQTQCNPLATGNDWFNLEIQDHPDILAETKSALVLGPGVSILQRLPLCVEISVKTVEGDQMVLEVWSLDVVPPPGGAQRGNDDKDVTDAAVLKGVSAATVANGVNGGVNNSEHQTLKAAHTYNRMGMLLKSVISLTRVTPAYKISRCQCPEDYGIYYRIYVDRPQVHLLGDGYKFLTIGELNTVVGTLKMELSYRTKMTISPTKAPVGQARTGETNTIMLKSDHFRPNDIAAAPAQNAGINALTFGKKGLNGCNGADRKVIDIEKPLKPGAFVDLNKLRQYTEEDYVLPETPPFEWLLRRNRNESGDSGSLESLTNRKSESPASSPISAATSNNSNINNNNFNSHFNSSNGSNTNITNNNSSTNINNNSPAFKGFETTNVVDKTTTHPKSASPAAHSTLSQSPLKSLFGPAKSTTKHHGSAPNLPRTTSAPNQCDEENLLKELNFPFASPTSHVNDLAKFYRDCYHAPPLRGVSPAFTTTCSTEAAYTKVDGSGFVTMDDLSRQLEQFETSMPDYEQLVASLTGSSSTGSRSSGGGLQMSN